MIALEVEAMFIYVEEPDFVVSLGTGAPRRCDCTLAGIVPSRNLRFRAETHRGCVSVRVVVWKMA